MHGVQTISQIAVEANTSEDIPVEITETSDDNILEKDKKIFIEHLRQKRESLPLFKKRMLARIANTLEYTLSIKTVEDIYDQGRAGLHFLNQLSEKSVPILEKELTHFTGIKWHEYIREKGIEKKREEKENKDRIFQQYLSTNLIN